jgi:hypothetical protein
LREHRGGYVAQEKTMFDDPRETTDVDGDSSDVVTGPIGNARLVEPSKADGLGADLDELSGVKSGDDPASGAAETPPA